MFKKIGLAKENESPENPGALEKRVALIPDDVDAMFQWSMELVKVLGLVMKNI